MNEQLSRTETPQFKPKNPLHFQVLLQEIPHFVPLGVMVMTCIIAGLTFTT